MYVCGRIANTFNHQKIIGQKGSEGFSEGSSMQSIHTPAVDRIRLKRSENSSHICTVEELLSQTGVGRIGPKGTTLFRHEMGRHTLYQALPVSTGPGCVCIFITDLFLFILFRH